MRKFIVICKLCTVAVLVLSFHYICIYAGVHTVPERYLLLPFILLVTAAGAQLIVDVIIRYPSKKMITAKSIVVVTCLSLLAANFLDYPDYRLSTMLSTVTTLLLILITLYAAQWLLNVKEKVAISMKQIFIMGALFIVSFFMLAKEDGLDGELSTILIFAYITGASEMFYNYFFREELGRYDEEDY